MMLDRALAAAAAGWPVFPCAPDTKRPLLRSEERGEGGVKFATTDAAQVRAWFEKWPRAMIGARLGASPAQGGEGAGLFVLDLDPKEGDAWALLDRLRLKLAEFKAWADDLGPAATLALSTSYALPPCPVTVTPRGGLHLWFRYPAAEKLPGGKPVGNRMNILAGYAAQIDVRSNDGYVIIPPSVRAGPKAVEEGCDGTAYEWLEGASFSDLGGAPEATPEILRLVLERHREAGEARAQAKEGPAERPAPQFSPIPPRAAVAGVDPRSGAIVKFVAAAFAGEVAKVAGAGEGSRNSALNNAALSLGHHVGAGSLSESEVRAALLSAAEQNGMIADDGLRAAEMTLDSGLSAGISDPATYEHVGRRAGLSNRPPPITDIDDRYARTPAPPLGEAMGGGAEGPREYPEPDDAEAWEAWHGQPPGGSDGDLPPPPPGEGEPDDDDEPEGDRADRLVYCCAQELNDTGNGKRLRARYGANFFNVDIAENPTSGFGMHVWAGTHWDQVSGHRAVQRYAQRTANKIRIEAEILEMTVIEQRAAERGRLAAAKPKAEQTDEDREAIGLGQEAKKLFNARKTARAKFSISSGNGPRLAHMVAQAIPHCTIQPEILDADPRLINVRNGTLRVGTKHDPECPDGACKGECGRTAPAIELRPHDRADRISKLMPVEYDPAATCPKFMAFLVMVQPDESIRDFLRLWHGLALTGLTEQAFVLNFGTGANGKTTFIETIAKIMGNYAQTLPAEALVGDQQRRGDQATPELARLHGARLVRAAELPRGQSFRESTLKLLTGGDPMPVRHLHGKFWDLKPIFKAVGSCNEKPDIIGVDEGIWRRVRLVPWTQTIPYHERRKFEDVQAEFMAEASGILNWLLEGLVDYLENGLIIPKAIRDATEEYRDDSDPVGMFIKACVTIYEPPAADVPPGTPRPSVGARAFYDAYTAYCHANNIKAFSQKVFGIKLSQKDFVKEKGGIIKYLDISLHDVPADPDKKHSYREAVPPHPGNDYEQTHPTHTY